MDSLLLGRNGRVLMPILALLLMNVPVAEAKFEWPEGTMGNFAMVGLVFTSITVGSGMIGTFVYVYRTIFGIPHQSHAETNRRLRESREWLEYIRWNATTQNPTTHPLHEGATARVFDLEKQLFEEPPPTRALPVRFFKCLIRTAKRCYASATSGGNPTSENSRDKGKAPERRIPPHPLRSIAQRDGFKIGAYHTIYPATAPWRPGKSPAARRSRKSTAARQARKWVHRHRSKKIAREPGEIGIHYASYKPRDTSRKSAHRTKSTTTKDGGKISAYDPKGRSRKPIHRHRAAINSFHRLLRAAKNSFSPPPIITGDDLTIENTRRNIGKAPERCVPAPPQISALHRHRHRHSSATTMKDGVMNVTHGWANSAHRRSSKPAHGHRHRSATHSARRLSRSSTPEQKLAKLLRGHFHAAKNGLITLASGDGSNKSSLDKGKAPEPRIPPESEPPIAHRHRHSSKHATSKDGIKTRTHRRHPHTCSKARSKHATTKDDINTRTRRHHHRTCSRARSKHATARDGSKPRTHRRHPHTCSKARSEHATTKDGRKPKAHRRQPHTCSKATRQSTRLTQKHKFAKIFHSLSRAAKIGLITLANGDGSNKSRLDKGKAPEPRIPPQSETPTAHSHRHRHRSNDATTKGGNKPRTHRHHRTCSKARSKHSTTNNGGVKSRAHRHHHRSLRHFADKRHESWNQHGVITRLPQAHTGPTPLNPSKPLIRFALDPIRPPCPPCPPHRARKPFQSGAPTSVFDLFQLLSRKPVPPPGGSISGVDRAKPKSRKFAHLPGAPDYVRYHFEPEYHTPVLSPKTTSIFHPISRKPVPPPDASVSILDLSQPVSRKPVPSTAPPRRAHLSHAISHKPVPASGASISADALSNPQSQKPISPSASSSMANLSYAESGKSVFLSASSSAVLNSSDTMCRKPVSPSASSGIPISFDSSGTICRKPVFPSAPSSSVLNSSGTVCRHRVFPRAYSSAPNSSDTICRKNPISSSESFGVPDISHGVSRRGLGWYEKKDERIP